MAVPPAVGKSIGKLLSEIAALLVIAGLMAVVMSWIDRPGLNPWSPKAVIAHLPLALATVIVGTFVSLLVHEGAHVVVARLTGHIVKTLRLGIGPSLGRFQVGGIAVHLRAIPSGGLTVWSMSGQTTRTQVLLITVAGPAANLALAVLAMPAVFNRTGALSKLMLGVALLSVWEGAAELGSRPPTPDACGTDGWHIRRLLRRSHEPNAL